MDVVGTLAVPPAPPARGADGSTASTAATPGFGRELKRAMNQGERMAVGAEPPAPIELDAAHAPVESEEVAAEETFDTAAAEPNATGAVPRRPILAEPKPGGVQRSLELLAPPFRSKLERVIERMRDEFGYEVRVVETWRSQDRQDALYAQGRTAEGPTVTWTRASKHLHGRAADLIIDGGYEDPAAYVRLGRIAAEEGLRSLGPKDPGHVELPGAPALDARAADARLAAAPRPSSSAFAAVAQVASAARPAGVAQDASVARPAGVAQVANIARPANVAEVAKPARIGMPFAAPRMTESSAGAGEPTVPANTIVERVPGPVAIAAAGAETVQSEAPRQPSAEAGLAAAHRERLLETDVMPVTPPAGAATRPTSQTAAAAAISAQPAAESTPEERETVADLFALESDGVLPQTTGSSEALQSRPARVAPTAGNDFAARVARVLSLRDAAEAAPIMGVTLLVDNVDGAAARIRLGLRGATVGATIDVADAVAANDLRARVSELRTALERNGLEPGAILVRGPGDVKDATSAARGIVATQAADVVAQTGRPTDSNSSQERHPGAPRRDTDSPDQRQKRQSKENHT